MTFTEFAGKVAIVTGGAGGIGRAVVLRLATAGTLVAAVDIDEQAMKAVAGDAAEQGVAVTAFAADVTSAEQVEALVDDVERRIGPVDFLVNTAGILRSATALETTEEQWEQTFAVNVGGVFRMSIAVGRRMASRRRGAIVTVASNAASVPRARMAAYSASKAAAVAFTKNLALELAAYGIRCNVVAPGSTETPMLWSLWADETDRLHSLDGDLSEYRVGIPLRKFAQPADVADAVQFLLSDRASHVTMQSLYVDGGAALGC